MPGFSTPSRIIPWIPIHTLKSDLLPAEWECPRNQYPQIPDHEARAPQFNQLVIAEEIPAAEAPLALFAVLPAKAKVKGSRFRTRAVPRLMVTKMPPVSPKK